MKFEDFVPENSDVMSPEEEFALVQQLEELKNGTAELIEAALIDPGEG
jgi:hypothetical protein